jgi:hypothetical protein
MINATNIYHEEITNYRRNPDDFCIEIINKTDFIVKVVASLYSGEKNQESKEFRSYTPLHGNSELQFCFDNYKLWFVIWVEQKEVRNEYYANNCAYNKNNNSLDFWDARNSKYVTNIKIDEHNYKLILKDFPKDFSDLDLY